MTIRGLVRQGAAHAQVGGFTRAGLVGSILVLVVAATCVRLGIWQLDRLEQRRATNALALERMAAPPVDVDDLADDSARAAYRRIRLGGRCEGPPVVLAARSRQGSPGVHLLCRFRTQGGRVVLLDRGWLPSADARTLDPELAAHLGGAMRDTTVDALAIPFPPGEETTGRTSAARVIQQEDGAVTLAERAPRVIYRLNRAQAQAVLGADLPAWYAQALGPGGAMPVPIEPPDLGEGPHLGYAVQWFSFASIALIGWLVLVVRRRPRIGAPDATAPHGGDEPHP